MVDPIDPKAQSQSLIKIPIGVAWLDDEIQAEERADLGKVTQAHQLDGEPKLESLQYAGCRR